LFRIKAGEWGGWIGRKQCAALNFSFRLSRRQTLLFTGN
jgi:hypothetical protein